MDKQYIYLDHGASTPLDPRVLEAMQPYWSDVYGNTSSYHAYGRSAAAALKKARETVAAQINAQPDEIVFTGCGSESDNLALRGAMWAARAQNQGNHLITSSIEHSAISETAVQLRDLFGFELTILPVDAFGQIKLSDLEEAVRPDTVLISIMAANNEIGALQPVEAIGEIARAHDILFHSDAIQAMATQPWDMAAMPVDLLSIAPHKFYGPKGVGILYVRAGIQLESILTGGGQENGRRAGTVNVPFAVGAAKALQLAVTNQAEAVAHYQTLRNQLIEGILTAFPDDCRLTGHPEERLPHNASFAFRGISGNDLLMHLDMAGILASSGSACSSGNPKPSAVLEAIGLDSNWTKGGLRLTVGKQNTPAEIDIVLEKLPGIIEKLQKINAYTLSV